MATLLQTLKNKMAELKDQLADKTEECEKLARDLQNETALRKKGEDKVSSSGRQFECLQVSADQESLSSQSKKVGFAMLSPVPFLDNTTVATHLQWTPLVDAVERVMADFSRGDDSVQQPVRSSFDVPHHSGWFASMSAFVQRDGAIATKLITSYPRNISAPRIQSTIILHAPEDGQLLAMMSGEHITAWRTAAASVVAARHLAATCRVVAIIGSGVQARSHAQAFSAAHRDVQEVRIAARNRVAVAELVSSLAKEYPGVKFVHCGSVDECIDGADVINTTTSSADPILFDSSVPEKGVHINVVGGRVPNKTELDTALFRRAVVFTDSRAGFKKEVGRAGIDVVGEIGQLIVGTVLRPAGGVTVFVSHGMAVQDAVAAQLVWKEFKKIQLSH